MSKKLTIIGSGAWGTALASVLENNFDKTVIWSYLQDEAEDINAHKKNTVYLPGVDLYKVEAKTSLPEAVKGSTLL
ncbi:MAG: glycerol-3-phosphate dehydrogenase, partial [Patescibacteria group bacterium]